MRALITGGCGFIGSYLSEALMDRGDEVTVVDDLSTGKRENIDERAEFFELSVNDDELARVFEEVPNLVSRVVFPKLTTTPVLTLKKGPPAVPVLTAAKLALFPLMELRQW